MFGTDIPVHLCTYHVIAAWHKQIYQKATPAYHNKAGIAEIFGKIHMIMTMEAAADKESSIKAVRDEMDAFLAKWAGLGEHAIHNYFKREWSPRIGTGFSPDSVASA
jgi:predicted house-cleaning NTP pyrophosphatase (Maf/HAM1 superfamily)